MEAEEVNKKINFEDWQKQCIFINMRIGLLQDVNKQAKEHHIWLVDHEIFEQACWTASNEVQRLPVLGGGPWKHASIHSSFFKKMKPFSESEDFEKTIDPHAEPLLIFEGFPNTPSWTSIAPFLPEATRWIWPKNRSDKGCMKKQNREMLTHAAFQA